MDLLMPSVRQHDLLHNGAGSFERAREIVLKILE
jgi:hypothetical protein